MFSEACKIARKFTFPIIISSKNYKGECNSGIGTIIIINEEGWFITAYHVIAQIQQLSQSNKEYKELLSKKEEIEKNVSLKSHVKNQQIKNLKIPSTAITNFSTFLISSDYKIGEIYTLPEVDLAVCRIINFNKSHFIDYPKFKDATKPMEQGTSLCKLGFPFHTITPTFEEGKGFNLPAGSLPIPIFPIDGIYTRTVNIQPSLPKPYPLKYIETSTPGLRGQSGGPTFDVNGTIWAIQSQTQHLKLGFGSNPDGAELHSVPTKKFSKTTSIHKTFFSHLLLLVYL
jgi:S1-C subfamily serine protease